MKNITELLPESIRKELGEDSLKAIVEAFEQAVETKVNEKVNLAVECAEANFDEEARKNIDELMEMSELNYKLKTAKAFNVIKEKHEKQIQKLKAHYEKQLKEHAETFKKQLVARIDESIKKGVARAIPTKQLKESLRNHTAMNVLKHMRELLAVNESAAKQAIMPAIREAKKRIDEGVEKSTLLEERNKTLVEENKSLKASLYLAERTKSMSPDAQNYIKRVMKGATEKFIKENLDSVYGMFQSQDNARREAVAKSTLEARLSSKQSKETQKLNRGKLVERRSRPAAKPINESSVIGDFISMLESAEED